MTQHVHGRERDALILRHIPLVHSLARRYANRGEPLDDLKQVGSIGLIKAVDRFDPRRGSSFTAFAAPTILGEIKRHFRDRTWSMRVPRALKDDSLRVAAAASELATRTGRTASTEELATATGLDAVAVTDALGAHAAYRTRSLSEGPPDPDGDSGPMEIADIEPGYSRVEDRAVFAQGLSTLPARDRLVVLLRVERDLTQSEIGALLGISQMHVSRVLSRSIDALRAVAGEDDDAVGRVSTRRRTRASPAR
jgi:RNA polymerase sigma-B factor